MVKNSLIDSGRIRRKILTFAMIGCLAASFILFLNINVSYRQGINYEVRVIKLPLYLKVLDFFDRHYNYKQLAKDIIKDAGGDEEKILKILGWTYNNIKRIPEDFPVIDDHIWHVIVRRYGTNDQSQDVFATLCNHSGMDAFFNSVHNRDKTKKKLFSFVKLRSGWAVFDAYNGVYFKNRNGHIATVKEMLGGDSQAIGMKEEGIALDNYAEYLTNLDSINYKNFEFSRSAIQSPLRRLFAYLINRIKYSADAKEKQ